MNNHRILITSIFLHPGGEVDLKLRKEGCETIYKPFLTARGEDELIELLREVDGVIVSSDPFTARVLDASPQLKVISRTGVGYDAIDVKAATARGIIVCNTPGVNRHAVTEWTFALLLSCSRKLKENQAEVRAGGWTRHEGIDLAGKTLGLVGLGTIGKEVAQRADAFEMRILACDVIRDTQFAEAHRVTFVSLEELLRESDFVSLHTFQNEKTRHLINAERLALMKPTAFLINTARGGIVDTEALCRALTEKRIAGAALDVFEGEPLRAESTLRAIANLYLSPHVAGATADARRLSGAMAADNLVCALNGERPPGILNPDVLAR
ncbi:MAG: phosphoglycerate dehydrogenase [Deltaproteobacteria bacterium]